MCHCFECQRRTGAPFGAQSRFRREQVQVEGLSSTYTRVADSGNTLHRRFCPTCGTPLFSAAESRPHLVFVRAGTLDDPEMARPAATIWTVSAPSWACIDADLPRIERQPPPAA